MYASFDNDQDVCVCVCRFLTELLVEYAKSMFLIHCCKLLSETTTPIRQDREQKVEEVVREEKLVFGFVNV